MQRFLAHEIILTQCSIYSYQEQIWKKSLEACQWILVRGIAN